MSKISAFVNKYTELKKETEQVPISEEVQQDQIPSEHIPEPQQDSESSWEEMQRRFQILNPKTGLRYEIPLLDRNSPDYIVKYAKYMKILERDPKTFDKIIWWN